jgi:hypothetical protein
LHPNNPVLGSNPATSSYVLKYYDGTPYHPTGIYTGTGWDIYYVVNFTDDNVMSTITTNYANVINQLGVDMIYLDGTDLIGTEALGDANAQYYFNKFLEMLLSKISSSISVQIVFPYNGPMTMHLKRQSIGDGMPFLQDKSLKDWIDGTLTDPKEQGSKQIIYYRYRLLNPELGWLWYYSAKDVSEYDYAFSAGIALGTPLVLEGDWSNTFVSVSGSANYAAFISVLDKYLPIYNQYAGRTVLKGKTFYPYGETAYVYTQYESGLAGFYVIGNTDLPAGDNRNIWIHVAQNRNVIVNLKFTGLQANKQYFLVNGANSQSVISDSQGRATASLQLSSSMTEHLFTLSSYSNPADLDDNGVVDIFDLRIVATNIGKSPFDSRADTNKDGAVDIFDIVFVASRFTT